MPGIFNDEEKLISSSFESKFKSEVETFNNLLDVYSTFFESNFGENKGH